MSWTTITAVLLIVYVVYGIATGRMAGLGSAASPNRSPQWVYRAKNPGQYWFLIVINLVVAAFLMVNPFHW